MLKLLLIGGGLAVAAATSSLVFIFSLGQKSVTYEAVLQLLDAAGQPLAHQPVVVWRYDYPRQLLRTDSAGQVRWQAQESFSASVLIGPKRPDVFLVRLAVPEVSPLYYRFEVGRKDSGPVPYQVFNTEYDYYFGHQWVGDVDAAGRLRREVKQGSPATTYQAVPPTGGQLLRWQATATLRPAGQQPDGRAHYTLALTLRQHGLALPEAP
ncbi:hypothetical protein QMK33_12105 [Hymenobacter sp. H14-R3]|uniref:hypothetical protein n=1 Tax=Hymenobacter sp. H14-R3 TaxID=3046308 RepID=UPI0024BB0D84|nr:hypothetical protein [Hymenobacter sp. H14-R3]MDJ0365897.1 hypothetical protein [Hymenobacter sp. H14-R3]